MVGGKKVHRRHDMAGNKNPVPQGGAGKGVAKGASKAPAAAAKKGVTGSMPKETMPGCKKGGSVKGCK